ncbi:MAG: sigma-70 family RNA polymerase sigma factor [Chloroflexi bacterium]|nr:sigma-70 family RNA polymerase sigma factor [Ardenticatenaceae bacterium]NOG36666.1 sigma-70 family RNA polymerase sigma factor [Chloroflexota bacterium]
MKKVGIIMAVSKRTNDEWLAELDPGHPNHQNALAELHRILVNGLRRGLLGQVQTTAPEFDTQAEDFAQEAIIKILEKKETFAGLSQFTTWAHKIAVSIALTELRRKRWQDNSLDSLTESDTGDFTPGFLADRNPTPESATERTELLHRVERLIMQDLTEKQRTALIASVIKGQSTEEVARHMDMKPNALYKLLHDARVRLKKALENEGLTPADILEAFE